MSDQVPVNPSGSPASSVAASSSINAPASAAAPRSLIGPRRGWVLLAFALFWLAIALHRASLGPSAGLVPTLALWIVGGLTLALWGVGAALALVSRGRFGPLAWFGVPVVLALGVLAPWQSRLFPLRLRAHQNELKALAEEHAWLPSGESRPVDRTIGGMRIESVRRVKNAELLVLRASSSRIKGIGYIASGGVPDAPPGDATTTRLSENWFTFDWAAK